MARIQLGHERVLPQAIQGRGTHELTYIAKLVAVVVPPLAVAVEHAPAAKWHHLILVTQARLPGRHALALLDGCAV